MGKAIKILFGVIGGLILLLIAGLVTAALVFDPNDYRQQIAAQVESRTGRSFSIDGDLSLRIFPWLAVGAEGLTLGNAEGFGPEPFARVERVAVGIQLLPLLLRREVVVDDVTLDGLALDLAVDASGRSNWQDLAEAQAEAPTPAEAPAEDGLPIESIDISSVAVRDASLRYRDAASGADHRIEALNLSTGRVRLNEPVLLNLQARYRGGEPEMTTELEFSGVVDADLDNSRATISQIALNLLASGEGIPGNKQSVALTGTLEFYGADGRLTLADGRLQAANVTADVNLQGSGLNGETPQFEGTLKLREFSPKAVAKALAIELPPTRDDKVLTRASLEGRFTATASSASLPELRAVLDDTTLTGNARIASFDTQRILFELKADRFNADRYSPPAAEEDAGDGQGESGNINDIVIPVELLEPLNAKGSFTIGELIASGLTLKDVTLQIDAPRGGTKNQRLSATGYGGNIHLDTRITPGEPPRYATRLEVGSVRAGQLLQDFLGKDLAEGVASMTWDLSSSGRTVGDVRRALSGTLSAQLSDGAVKGFNIAQTIRNARARLSGQNVEASAETPQTDFASLVASATVRNGVLQLDQLDGRNPLLRLLGDGKVDLARETLDLMARPTLVKDLSGQGGSGLEELAGLEIPIRITGNWADPKVGLDLKSVLRQQAESRLREAVAPQSEELKSKVEKETGRLEEKIDEKLGEGAGKALRSLFGGSSSQPQEAESGGE